MATEIFLVRHGQTGANVEGYYTGRSDEDLNELGYRQAHRLSSRMAELPISAIYTSPLQRACTTARIIAEPHRLEIVPLPDLTEIQLGDWQGMNANEIRLGWSKLWQQWRTDPSELRLPDGESYDEATERAVRSFKAIIIDNKNKHVVIVTHDAIIKVLIAHVLSVSNSIYRRIEIENASLSLVRITDHTILIKLNDTCHLRT
jgi:broad specificity phosphatase PhoE